LVALAALAALGPKAALAALGPKAALAALGPKVALVALAALVALVALAALVVLVALAALVVLVALGPKVALVALGPKVALVVLGPKVALVARAECRRCSRRARLPPVCPIIARSRPAPKRILIVSSVMTITTRTGRASTLKEAWLDSNGFPGKVSPWSPMR